MSSAPIRSGSSRPESYSQARKRKVISQKSTSQSSTPFEPVYTGATKSRIDGANNRITAKEKQLEAISTLENEARAKSAAFYEAGIQGKVRQAQYRNLEDARRKLTNKRQSIQRDIEDTKRNLARAKQGQTSVKQEANVKKFTAAKEKAEQKAFDEYKESIKNTRSSTKKEPIASYSRPASKFEISSGIRQDDGADWQVQTPQGNIPYTTFKEQQEQEIKTNQAEVKRIKAIKNSPFNPNLPLASSATGGVITYQQAEDQRIAREVIQREIVEPSKKRGLNPRSDINQFDSAIRIFNEDDVKSGMISKSELKSIKRVIASSDFQQAESGRKSKAIDAAIVYSAGVTVVAAPVVAGVLAAGTAATVAAPYVVSGLNTALETQTKMGLVRGVEKDAFSFRNKNPSEFETANKAGLQAQRDAVGEFGFIKSLTQSPEKTIKQIAPTFFNADKYDEAVVASLKEQDFSPSQIQEGREAADATLITRRGAIATTAVLAEVTGEFGGTVSRALIKKTDDFASTVTTAGIGGAAESGFAYGAYTSFSDTKITPAGVVIASGVGFATAGGFEFVRRNPVASTTTRNLATASGNIIEPQEFVVDNLISGVEKINRRTKYKKVDLAKKGIETVEVSPNKYKVRTLTTTATNDQNTAIRSRIKAFSSTSGSSSSGLIPSTTNTPTNSLTESLTYARANTKTNTNTFTNSLTNTQTQQNALVSSLTTAKTTTESRTLTPPIPVLLPVQGGSAAFPRQGKRTSKRKKGYSKSIAGSLFGNAYKALGAKSTYGGVVSGLGVRF